MVAYMWFFRTMLKYEQVKKAQYVEAHSTLTLRFCQLSYQWKW